MLSFFKKNHFIRSLILIVYTIVLKIPLFFYPYPEYHSGGYLSDQMIPSIENDTLAILLSALLIYLQAVYINKIVIENRITKESTLFPGFFYILMTSIIPELGVLSAALLGMFPLLIAIDYLMQLYKKADYSGKIFNMGFWVSLASLFYFPYLYFAIFFFIGISILKFIKGLDIFRMLIGLATPYLLTFYYFMWNGVWKDGGTYLFGNYTGRFGIPLELTLSLGLKMAILLVILLIGILNYGQYIKKKNVQAINKIDIVYWGSVLAGVTLLLATPLTIYHLYTLLPFLAIMLAMMFINIQSAAVAETIHFALLGLGFYMHYLTFV